MTVSNRQHRHFEVTNVSDPVYAPNSYGGPKADPERAADVHWYTDGDMVRSTPCAPTTTTGLKHTRWSAR
jgi:hypothetical protein